MTMMIDADVVITRSHSEKKLLYRLSNINVLYRKAQAISKMKISGFTYSAAIVLIVCIAPIFAFFEEEMMQETQPQPSACVSLLVYEDFDCSGEPLRSLTFPTWTEMGSPCYHDATMLHFSVRHQYCDVQHGSFHQQIFLLNQQCQVKWYNSWISPQKQKFTTTDCEYGIKLDYCVEGPCPSRSSDGTNNNPPVEDRAYQES